MKTKQEIEKMKDEIQVKIDEAHQKALSAHHYRTSDEWFDRKRQLMAQYNILLKVLS